MNVTRPVFQLELRRGGHCIHGRRCLRTGAVGRAGNEPEIGDAGSSTNRVPSCPAERSTLWNPGMMGAGGIPVRSTVCSTLTPERRHAGRHRADSGRHQRLPGGPGRAALRRHLLHQQRQLPPDQQGHHPSRRRTRPDDAGEDRRRQTIPERVGAHPSPLIVVGTVPVLYDRRLDRRGRIDEPDRRRRQGRVHRDGRECGRVCPRPDRPAGRSIRRRLAHRSAGARANLGGSRLARRLAEAQSCRPLRRRFRGRKLSRPRRNPPAPGSPGQTAPPPRSSRSLRSPGRPSPSPRPSISRTDPATPRSYRATHARTSKMPAWKT